MNGFWNRGVRGVLLSGCGCLALIASAHAQEAAAPAQTGDDESVSADIVVTGSRIRGVGAVGAPVIQFNQEAIADTGLGSTADVVKKTPQVAVIGTQEFGGGNAQQAGSRDFTYAKSANLRGLGTVATLSLFNGHRVVPQGPSADYFDPDVLPIGLLERIEVVANGSSAIYGSDAVAGVVNYIWRRPYDGAESLVRYGFSDTGVRQWQASQSFGVTWEGGGILLGVERAHSDALEASQRPELFDTDMSPFGGNPSPNSANPGNVVFGGVNYPIPTGQDGRTLGTGQFVGGTPRRQNLWTGVEVSPEHDRTSFAGTITQRITPWLELFGEGYWSERDFKVEQWPVTATLSVPHTNPFSPCYTGAGNTHPTPTGPLAAACTSATSLSVATSYLGYLGTSTRQGWDNSWNAVVGARFDLPFEWKGFIQGGTGTSDLYQSQRNTPNATALSQVLGSAAGRPTDVPFLNVFCDGPATTCNSEATLNHIRAFSDSGRWLERNDYLVNIDGPVFSLPGGEVRLSLGAEMIEDYIDDRYNCFNNSTTGVGVVTCRTPRANDRTVRAAFGEVFVPLVGPDNAVPGIAELSFTAAVRRDDYSDVGETTNPNYGVVYAPVAGFRFRGSYGTSFRAPSPNDLGGNPNTLGNAIARNVLPLTAPNAVGPDMTAVYRTGGNPGMSPEDATTWSVGFDISRDLIEGFTGAFTYYNVEYTGLVGTPGFNVGPVIASTAPEFAGYRIYSPRYFAANLVALNPVENVLGQTFDTRTVAGFDAIVAAYIAAGNLLQTSGPNARVPENVAMFLDGRRRNAGTTETSGLDFYANYEWDMNGGEAHIGGIVTYVLNYDTSLIPGGVVTDKVNKFSNPLQLRARADIGWDNESWNFNAFINYVNAYEIERSFLPAGAPASFQDIDSLTTVDLTVGYRTQSDDWLANDIGITLSVENLFDADPPFVINTGTQPIRFDPANANPIGRLMAVQLTKRW